MMATHTYNWGEKKQRTSNNECKWSLFTSSIHIFTEKELFKRQKMKVLITKFIESKETQTDLCMQQTDFSSYQYSAVKSYICGDVKEGNNKTTSFSKYPETTIL